MTGFGRNRYPAAVLSPLLAPRVRASVQAAGSGAAVHLEDGYRRA